MKTTFRLTKFSAEKFLESYCIDDAPIGAIERLTAPLKLDTSREERAMYTVQLERGFYVNQKEIDAIVYGK